MLSNFANLVTLKRFRRNGETPEHDVPVVTPLPTTCAESRTLADIDLHNMATKVVALYNLAPSLAQTAERLDDQALEQAHTAKELSEKTAGITKTLNSVIVELETSASEAFSSLTLIKEITDATKILGINAAIEAARAGESGRSFAVLATEMQRLAMRTEEISQQMTETLEAMQNKVTDVVRVVGKKEGSSVSPGSEKETASVAAVTRSFHSINARATEQQQEAHQIREMSDKTRKLSEGLLLEVGKLRFELHAKSEAAVSRLIRHPDLYTASRDRVEPLLIRAIQAFSFFDLLYVTDATGRQITRNIGQNYSDPRSGEDSLGKDWSARPWLRNALEHDGPCTSDLYLSVTTNRFCFTVSEAIRDELGDVIGVLGADVDFERLLQQ